MSTDFKTALAEASLRLLQRRESDKHNTPKVELSWEEPVELEPDDADVVQDFVDTKRGEID